MQLYRCNLQKRVQSTAVSPAYRSIPDNPTSPWTIRGYKIQILYNHSDIYSVWYRFRASLHNPRVTNESSHIHTAKKEKSWGDGPHREVSTRWKSGKSSVFRERNFWKTSQQAKLNELQLPDRLHNTRRPGNSSHGAATVRGRVSTSSPRAVRLLLLSCARETHSVWPILPRIGTSSDSFVHLG